MRFEAGAQWHRACSVTVSGGGPGPDAEEVAHLFERFYRGRSAAEAGQSGSGLGLFTARGIARSHGGDVRRIDGDSFEIELPLKRLTLVARTKKCAALRKGPGLSAAHLVVSEDSV